MKKSCVAACQKVSGWPWNRCPDARGMSVRISVESLSGCAWNGCPSQRGIRSLYIKQLAFTSAVLQQLMPATDSADVDVTLENIQRAISERKA